MPATMAADTGVLPCGLAARNTLRLEAGMALYGHEIDEDDDAAGSEPRLDLQTEQRRLHRSRAPGEAKGRRVCEGDWLDLKMTERGIARDGQEVVINGERVGKVTSGSPAPYLKKNIGMAYVPAEFAN